MRTVLDLTVAITLGLVALAGACVIAACLWFLWELHPWTPPGSSLALGSWQFGEYQFQVWQRKNFDTFEPFADGLFVRHGTNSWQAFCFDIQDGYSPRVRLEQRGTEIVVYLSGEQRGVYDMTAQEFRRGGPALTPGYVTGDPPGDWWARR